MCALANDGGRRRPSTFLGCRCDRLSVWHLLQEDFFNLTTGLQLRSEFKRRPPRNTERLNQCLRVSRNKTMCVQSFIFIALDGAEPELWPAGQIWCAVLLCFTREAKYKPIKQFNKEPVRLPLTKITNVSDEPAQFRAGTFFLLCACLRCLLPGLRCLKKRLQ